MCCDLRGRLPCNRCEQYRLPLFGWESSKSTMNFFYLGRHHQSVVWRSGIDKLIEHLNHHTGIGRSGPPHAGDINGGVPADGQQPGTNFSPSSVIGGSCLTCTQERLLSDVLCQCLIPEDMKGNPDDRRGMACHKHLGRPTVARRHGLQQKIILCAFNHHWMIRDENAQRLPNFADLQSVLPLDS